MNKKKLWVSILAGIMAVVMLLSLVAGIVPMLASAKEASSSEIKNQIAELEKQEGALQDKIDALEEQVSDNMSEMEKMVAQKDVIDQEIAIIYRQISNINDQITAYGLLIADKQEELDAAEARLAELTQQNRERIRAMEEDGTMSYWSVLLNANSFADLLDRINMVQEIAAADNRRLEEMNAAADLVAQAQATLEEEKASLVAKKQELSDMQAAQKEKREQTNELLTKLNAKGEEYLAFIAQREEEMNQLHAELTQKEKELKEAERREYEEWLATSIPPTTKPRPTVKPEVTPPSSVVNGLTWYTPIRYTMFSSPYGMRIHPIYGDWRMHTGVDLAAPYGRDIWASRGGKVTLAEWNGGYGNCVIIDHGDGFKTLYAHMEEIKVSEGQNVSAKQVIGACGSTGNSTGPHLHFEVIYKGSTQNPADYIDI